MKPIDPEFQTSLTIGATTHCWCWRIMRRDGHVLGFTDHDRNLTFAGTHYQASSGFTGSEIEERLGLSVDNLEVQSAVSSEALSEADLAAGLYDNAEVQIYRVDWAEPSRRVLVRTGTIGEVRRSDSAFSCEIRGLAHYLQQTKGRLFQYGCDADLGDRRCGIDLASSTYRGVGMVISVADSRRFFASGLDAYGSDWFTRGLLRFTSGAATGQSIEVKSHRRETSGSVNFELWAPARLPLVAGQTFVVTAGCDKHLGTCSTKFTNVINFRGFPFMPGNDAVVRGPTR